MPFDSLNFWILFFPFLGLYWAIPQYLKNPLALCFSLFLYGWWNWLFLIPLLISTLTDYLIGLLLSRDQKTFRRKIYLGLSLLINLSLLAVFKYFRSSVPLELFEGILLPVGISFYTFQSLSYTIDIYFKKIRPSQNFLDFFLYVSFFPQLVAGPIEKARRLFPQIIRVKKTNSLEIERAFYLCLLGLTKKQFIAPLISTHAEYIWSYGDGSFFWLFIGGILTTLQVYFDFSAYSDLARGLACSMGYKIIINFRPFIFSKNPTEFWQCWHISLTQWIREYLLIGTRKSNWPVYIKRLHLLVSMCLVGLWHDWTLNWFLFGLFHGVTLLLYLSGRPLFSKVEKLIGRIPTNILAYGFMFFVYAVSGYLHALYYFPERISNQLQSLHFEINHVAPTLHALLVNSAPAIIPWLLFESYQHYSKDYDFILHKNMFTKVVYTAICFAMIFYFDRSLQSGFIYFDF